MTSDFASWGAGVGELVRHAERITKVRFFLATQIVISSNNFYPQYGLYDRPELQQWHKGRVVLLGDAAHPTSPVCHFRFLFSTVPSAKNNVLAHRSGSQPSVRGYRSLDNTVTET